MTRFVQEHPFWSLIVGVTIALFGWGFASGWSQVRSDASLLSSAIETAHVLPQPNRNFAIVLKCRTNISYVQYVDSLNYISHPSDDKVEDLLERADAAIKKATPVAGSAAITYGVLGGSAADLLKNRFSSVRAGAFRSAGKSLAEHVKRVGALIVAAGAGYFAGDALARATRPDCASRAMARFLSKSDNRESLQRSIHELDRAKVSTAEMEQASKAAIPHRMAIDDPEMDDLLAMNGRLDAMREAVEKIQQDVVPTSVRAPEYLALIRRCQAVAVAKGRRVCQYL